DRRWNQLCGHWSTMADGLGFTAIVGEILHRVRARRETPRVLQPRKCEQLSLRSSCCTSVQACPVTWGCSAGASGPRCETEADGEEIHPGSRVLEFCAASTEFCKSFQRRCI